jgi:hypothetical protein
VGHALERCATGGERLLGRQRFCSSDLLSLCLKRVFAHPICASLLQTVSGGRLGLLYAKTEHFPHLLLHLNLLLPSPQHPWHGGTPPPSGSPPPLPAGVVLLPRSCAAASSSRVAAAGFGHGQASSCPVRKCKTQNVPCRCSGLCTLCRRRSHSLRKSAKRVQHRGPAPPLRLTPWKPAGDRGLGAVPTSSQLHRLHASVLAQR